MQTVQTPIQCNKENINVLNHCKREVLINFLKVNNGQYFVEHGRMYK